MTTEIAKRQAAAKRAQLQLHKALSHELRVDILTYLSEHGTGSASEMARQLGESIKGVSHHAQQLLKYGFVEIAELRPVKKGTAEKVYRGVERPLLTDELVGKLPGIARDSFAGQILERSYGDAVGGFKAGAFREVDWHLTRTLLELDEEGWREVREIHDDALERVLDARERSKARLAASGEASIRVSSSQLCFRLP